MSDNLDNEARREETPMANRPPYPGAPRWVKVFGIIAIGLVVLVVIIVFTGVGGPHGPGRHMRSADAGDSTPPASVTRPGVQQP